MQTISINSTEIQVAENHSLLDAALANGIYIPHLCYHPDLPPHNHVTAVDRIYQGDISFQNKPEKEYPGGCNLCLVEMQDSGELLKACEVQATEGMVFATTSDRIQSARKEALSNILEQHPHACLSCAQRFGCALEPCSTKTDVLERCCALFGRCQLQKVAEYIGIPQSTPRFSYENRPKIEDQPLYHFDFNLCIGCTICVRACNDLRGVGALGAVANNGNYIIGTTNKTLKESACKFCGACVEVCPTGAIIDKKIPSGEREKALVPCIDACPAGIDIPRYIRFIEDGKYDEAVAVVREKVPLPHVLGQVCYRPCETVCRRIDVDESVAICALKEFAAEHDGGSWKVKLQPVTPSEKKVAIIGSGPAGLSAAYFLARKGHSVTIIEALSKLGGMLRYGIPNYRLQPDVLDKEIKDILELGIEVRTNTSVSSVSEMEKLFEEGFEAIVLSPGKQKSKNLDVDGKDLDGVLTGLEFLSNVYEGQIRQVKGPVVVIGGGNVAIDVARSVRRLGAEDIKLVCLEARDEMPAHDWEVHEMLGEGIALECGWGPRRIVGKNGLVTGVEFSRTKSLFDEEGKFNPQLDHADRITIDANTVIIAIGQESVLSMISHNAAVKLTARKRAEKQSGNGNKNIFMCGDATDDCTNVIEVIASARVTASEVDSFLGGNGNIEEKLAPSEEVKHSIGRQENYGFIARVPSPSCNIEDAVTDFRPITTSYSIQQAQVEASRCLRCDLRLHINPALLPPEDWVEFSEQMVSSTPEEAGVYTLFDENKKVLEIKGVDNLQTALMKLIQANTAAKYFSCEEDPMFTRLESELMQKHLQQYGEMPGGDDDELDDLF